MPLSSDLQSLTAQIATLKPSHPVGRVSAVEAGVVHISGLADAARIGDWIHIRRAGAPALAGEVVQLHGDMLIALPDAAPLGVALNDRVILIGGGDIAPADHWIGRVIDPSGLPLDGKTLLRGPVSRSLRAPPPAAAGRRAFGPRLETGLAALNTFLPIALGQRVGLFAGSGVGKSSLLGHLAKNMQTDVAVIALIGERGRELRHFIDEVLGPEGLRRSIVVTATSDQSPLHRRRCAWTAMAIAEHFRDQGKSVLFLADSITRFAEAHREVAVAAGEAPVVRGYPPSTAHQIMALCERAGTGIDDQGDITAIFSVLVAGSDMEEPIADILRGVLDGHVVLDRAIAERGRFPAIDVLRSVSRCLPMAASAAENKTLNETRKLMGLYDRNAMMIRAGLYMQGSDPEVDQAIALWSDLDDFLGRSDGRTCVQDFQQLELILRRARHLPRTGTN
ncbi:MAG: FliI/YscN family ATPase [Sulfitobacter sp.]